MGEEVKEKIKAYYVANDIDEILDYITNLQEEKEDYKSRCKKIKKIISSIFNNEDWYLNYDYKDLEDALKDIFKTINGGENNVKD